MNKETDSELLELAAKAGGELTPTWYGNDAYFDGVLSRWNPLTDDGDALRLAVKLGFNVEISIVHTETFVLPYSITVKHENDPYAATRRAIVRAAAEIGRNME